ncbi:hypothetical protein HYG81_01440 [Natrinema zhouii]|uniref:Uncharacterized protein n=1 Tax=Natrinema zhouii TaxID=1710539 RepID=A0A7D6CPZ8_9EURY|nr:hypothetical protein [Natrinema zhouii]QLK26316.1 hypothetical protein HYG81_01440 [Natrinema zhouii]
MTLSITVSDRFRDAATAWGDDRLMDEEAALETKAEQALLEIEHLVSGANEVEFDVDAASGEIHHEPTDDLEGYLERQSDEFGLEPDAVLALHVDLFASAFLDRDGGSESSSDRPDDPRPY